MIGPRDELRIGTLRARGEAVDQPGQRLALERTLGCADLMPSGLPPDGVLLVRHIRQSIPAEARRGAQGVMWADAVRERLGQLHKSAAIPRRGRVPADAEAILFADRAELLASLARDLMDATAWRHWWWRALLAKWRGDLGPSAATTAMLADEAERLPAVMVTLHSWGDAGTVLRSLGRSDLKHLLAVLAEAHGLTVIAGAIQQFERHTVPPDAHAESPLAGDTDDDHSAHYQSDDIDRASVSSGQRSEAVRAGISAGDDVPQHTLAGDATRDACQHVAEIAGTLPSRLSTGAALLLGLSAALTREPWRARDAAFQRAALSQWWLPPVTETHWPRDRDAAPASPSLTAARMDRGIERAASDPDNERMGAAGNAGDALPSAVVSQGYAQTGAPPSGALARVDESPRTEDCETAEAAPRLYGDAEGLVTELGGVLYLVNLMSALELPECFEDDWRLSSGLGPWALLELLARGLMGTPIYRYRHDPLWPALARLDGREAGQSIADRLAGRQAYRIPRAWLDALEDRSVHCRWASEGGWLRLWSAEGWLLAEVPRDSGAPVPQAHRELAHAGVEFAVPLRRAKFAAAPITPGTRSKDAACNRLLGLMLPYIRWRLALALGVDPNDPAAVEAVLQLRARLYISSSHIDLLAGLDDISLPARRAGLDRDPGWLPLFGRAFLFHFE